MSRSKAIANLMAATAAMGMYGGAFGEYLYGYSESDGGAGLWHRYYMAGRKKRYYRRHRLPMKKKKGGR